MCLGVARNMQGTRGGRISVNRGRDATSEPFVYTAVSGGREFDGPLFFVIGNRNNDSTKNTSSTTKVMHDFCLVVPDIVFHRKHELRLDGSSKLRKSDGKGRALYIRPLQPFAPPGIQTAFV